MHECDTKECKKQCIKECFPGKYLDKEPFEEFKKDKECTENCMAAAECDTKECKKQCIAECYPGKDSDKEPERKEQIDSRDMEHDQRMRGGKKEKKGGKPDQDREMRGDKKHSPGKKGRREYKKD